jgi:hypothetical protein
MASVVCTTPLLPSRQGRTEHNSHVFPSRPPLRTVLVRSLSESSCKRAGNASSEYELAGELASSLMVRSGD